MTLDKASLLRAGDRWDDRIARASAPGIASTDPIATEWLTTWRTAIDSDDAGLFAKRLQWSGLTEASASAMLVDEGGPDDAPWWPLLAGLSEHATRSAGAGGAEAWFATVESQLPEGARAVPFAHALAPIVEAAWAQVASRCALDHDALSADAVDALRIDLLGRLARIAARPLAELFTEGRAPGEALLASLGVGNATSRTGYVAFCHGQCADGYGRALRRYPVLGRLLATSVQTWIDVTVEMLTRLSADADLLADIYGIASPVRVLDIHLGAGDTHRGGRAVAILGLAGPDQATRVVMKPKDMAIEARFASLSHWFMGSRDEDVTVQVLERDGYGYTSFVEHAPCAPDRLDAFYRCAGRLLALLHLIGTTDGHAENLVACGEQFVLIDPETLFEGRVDSLSGEDDPPGSAGPLAESVLRVGALPSWTRTGPRSPAIDISALGVDVSEGEHHLVPGWLNVNTDAMAWGRVPAPPAITTTSLPVPSGSPNPIAEHVDALVTGFTEGYRIALDPDGRERLLASIEGFRGVRRRIVLRGTRIYGVLQTRAQSPHCLASANARGIELDRLSRSSLLGDAPGVHWECFGAELADLERGDIPYFDYPLGSRDIHATDRIIRDALVDDGLAQALERVRQASELDLHWQTQLIRASVGARQVRMGARAIAEPEDRAAQQVDDSTRHAAVHEILTRIDHTAIRDKRGQVTWLTLASIGDGTRVQLGTLDLGFYSGRAGLIAFLDAVARHSPDAEDRDRAARLLVETWTPLGDSLTASDRYDGFRILRDAGLGLNGIGGLLGVLDGGLTGIDPEHTDAARERILAAVIDGLIDRDEVRDVMGGSAGAVGPLLALRDMDPRIDDVLGRLAERILSVQAPDGGWPTAQARAPLTGLSHGASGLALALFQAGTALGREDVIAAGGRGFAYEHGVLDRSAGNWPDYRAFAEPGSAMLAWCHGAPGIALARLRALEILPDHDDAQTWREDAIVGATTTASVTDSGLDHLCCGNLGRAHVLQQVGRGLDDAALVARADDITAATLARWSSVGSFRLNDFGTGSSANAASCMTGLAGIGMHLLAPDGSLLPMLG